MASVTRDEFKIRSELEAVHLPTGAVFSAYPYSDPDDMLQSSRCSGEPARPQAPATMLSRSDVLHRNYCLSEQAAP